MCSPWTILIPSFYADNLRAVHVERHLTPPAPSGKGFCLLTWLSCFTTETGGNISPRRLSPAGFPEQTSPSCLMPPEACTSFSGAARPIPKDN